MKITEQVKIVKIFSGGQTGVDRAALDTAIELAIPHGGYCPKGRLAEDGIIPNKYKLTELKSSMYLRRTFENIHASDGTLIIQAGRVYGGTLITREYCQKESKPYFEINLLKDLKKIPVNFNHWMEKNTISILNIAGPRESEAQIYRKAKVILVKLLKDYILFS